MTTGTIRIRVGASLDRSVDATFGALEKRAQKAGRVVQQQLAAGFGRGGPYRTAPTRTPYEDGLDRARAKQKRLSDELARDQIRAWKQIGKVAEQELTRQARAQMRAQEQMSRAQLREQERFAQRTSYRATRFLFPPPSGILGSARRMGSDILAGVGVDFNLGRGVGRSVDLQRAAVALSNQGYQIGKAGPNGQRVTPETLVNEARGIATPLGLDPAKIIEAQTAFVSATGDLDTSRKSMAEMAKLSAATGSNVVELAQAQASVSIALGDTENKSKKIESIMRTIAGQGEIGSVEIKDLAKGMAGLAAQAPAFAGDVGANIEKLGALAQVAKGLGGAGTAREATIGVQRFVGALQTNARVNEFKAAGVSVYDKKGKIRDPFELIKESLVATKGDPLKMGKLWMSVMAQRGVRGLTTTFNAAGGGQAGLKAVQAEFDRFTKGAALSKDAVDKKAEFAAQSTAAKAQRFQNNLDVVAEKMATTLMPTLEKLAPTALKVTEAFAKLVDMAAKNPTEAIVLAIVAAIGRAGLEAAARGALERAILGSRFTVPATPGVPALPSGTPGAPVATAGGTSMLGPAALAAGGLLLAGDQANKLKNELGMKSSVLDMLPGFKGGSFSTDTLLENTVNPLSMAKKFAGIGGELGFKLSGQQELKRGMGFGGFASKVEAARLGVAPSDPAAIGRGVADALSGRELRVRLTNPDDIKLSKDAPKVDPGGRSPSPGKK